MGRGHFPRQVLAELGIVAGRHQIVVELYPFVHVEQTCECMTSSNKLLNVSACFVYLAALSGCN